MAEVTLTGARQIGGVWRDAGETVTLADDDARVLIAAGGALPATTAQKDVAPENRVKPAGQRR